VWATNSHTLFFSPLRSEGQGQPSERSRWRYVCERNDMQVGNRLEDEVCVLHYGLAIPRSRRWLAFGANIPFCQRICQICAQVMLSVAGWPRTLLHNVTSPRFPSEHFAQKYVDVPPLFLSGACSRSRPCTVFAVNAVPHCSREYLPSAPANDRRQLRWSYQRG
jgi:hypothetical protein